MNPEMANHHDRQARAEAETATQGNGAAHGQAAEEAARLGADVRVQLAREGHALNV